MLREVHPFSACRILLRNREFNLHPQRTARMLAVNIQNFTTGKHHHQAQVKFIWTLMLKTICIYLAWCNVMPPVSERTMVN